MNKHSQSPWFVVFEGDSKVFLQDSSGSTMFCIKAIKSSKTYKSRIADIKLMVAAPNMLNLLKDLVYVCDNTQNVDEVMSKLCAISQSAKNQIEKIDGTW